MFAGSRGAQGGTCQGFNPFHHYVPGGFRYPLSYKSRVRLLGYAVHIIWPPIKAIRVWYKLPFCCRTITHFHVFLCLWFIGGNAIEARRHVPPQILGPGGTLWSVRASSNFGLQFCDNISINTTFLSLLYRRHFCYPLCDRSHWH